MFAMLLPLVRWRAGSEPYRVKSWSMRTAARRENADETVRPRSTVVRKGHGALTSSIGRQFYRRGGGQIITSMLSASLADACAHGATIHTRRSVPLRSRVLKGGRDANVRKACMGLTRGRSSDRE